MSAVISPCGQYRYRLVRRWADGGSTCAWVMLNPSTADATTDDATIRKCLAFSKAWGCQAIEVVNLFAWRSTDPKAIGKVHDPIGDGCDGAIQAAAENCHVLVCAWGNGGDWYNRGDDVTNWLYRVGKSKPQCLGVNQNGTPKHPLYLPLTTVLRPYAVSP